MNRFFIALLPPPNIQDHVNNIKQYFADNYASCGAQKSPPHITLQPPFVMPDTEISILERYLREFAQKQQQLTITLSGFAAFPPHVIYINVLKSQALLQQQANLMNALEINLGIVDEVAKSRPFTPHLTVAFRDLTKQNFYTAWPEFQQRQLYFEFTASHLTLLIHDGKRWNIKSEFPYQNSEVKN